MNFKKLSMLLPLAALMMGNESCEQQQNAEKGRQLKKIVDVGRIAAPSLNFPNGAFDFGFVANQQFVNVLTDADGFALRMASPIISTPQGPQMKLTTADKALYSKMSFKSDAAPVQFSKEASCMVYQPMMRLAGSVNAFELVSSAGIMLGYNSNGTYSGAGLGGSLDFAMDSLQLDMSLYALPVMTNGVLAAASVTPKQTKTKVSFTINFGLFALGPKYYYQTPLASVTKKGLQMGVASLKEKLDSIDWYSRVLYNHDTHLTIVGGQNVGLEKGDKLSVYNEMYYWEGEPCASKYVGGAAQDPVAVIQIESVGDEISFGKVIYQTDENAVIGAKVKLLQFHD